MGVVPGEDVGLLAVTRLGLAFVVPAVVFPGAQIALDVIDVAMMFHKSFLMALRVELHHGRPARATNAPVMVCGCSSSRERSTDK